jgi:hypothetical protein
MNSFAKLLASISALIASLSFAWVTLTITGMNPVARATVTVHHNGNVDVWVKSWPDIKLRSETLGFRLWHDGSIDVTR